MARILLSACIFFYSLTSWAQQINKVEYFFNVDPGINAATAINFAPADSITLEQNIQIPASLPAGINVLFARAMNTAGSWSFPEIILFWKTTGGQPLSEMEYFFDVDPGLGAATPLVISNPADSVVVIQNITVPALSLGAHKLYVRTKNSDGTWSFPEIRNINICTAYGPVSQFNYYVNGPEIYFTDSSQLAVSRTWDFGDNSAPDTSVNPRHVFQQGNIYPVKLKTVNPCGIDSIIKTINLFGVQSITPRKAPSTGIFIGYIKGVGFLPGTTARLLQNNTINVPADTTIFIDSSLLKVVFNNSNEILGNYDLLVLVPGSNEYRLANALVMEPQILADVWVNLDGRRDFLVNRWNTFKIVYGNNSNQLAIGVPIVIRLPRNVEARITTPTADTGLQPPIIAYNPDQFYMVLDSLTNDSLRIGYFIIPWIEAYSCGEIIFELKSTATGISKITITAGNGFYTDNLTLQRRNPNSFCDPPPCVSCLLDLLGFGPGIGCAIGAYSMGCSLVNAINGGSQGRGMRILNFVGQLSGALLSCLPMGRTVAQLIQAAANAANNAGNANGAANDCSVDCFKPPHPDSIRAVNSWDPNVKVGPIGYNVQKYTRWQDPFNYTIYFENLASATAPASEVIVTDYLDSSKLDLQSLKFTGLGFADTSLNLEIADTVFIQDVDLRPEKQTIVRVLGQIDSVNKVQFRFISFDPLTMNPVSDPSQGFLNPNINGTEGLGFVRVQVKAKPGLPTGTLINNIASIHFDANAPIETPVCFNSIDKDKPFSNVLPITERINDSTYRVHWTGTDLHAGLRWYSIYVSTNDSPYVRKIRTDSLQFVFKGRLNSNYKFYSIAEDFVGNVEDPPAGFDQQIIMSPGPLPVSLIDFKAFRQNKNALLQWKTVAENNNRGFEVQRSLNGINFMSIGWVNGAGNSSSMLSYSFIDSFPGQAKNFYRLKQVDLNGRSTFTDIRMVDFTQQIDCIIYPNPAKNELTIQFQDHKVKDLTIYDVTGKAVWMKNNIKDQLLSVPVQKLSEGMYLIKINSEGDQSVLRFIKE